MSLNHVRPWRNIYRRKSRQIMVGNVPVGGDAPISVQTMTNTDTGDVAATVAQVLAEQPLVLLLQLLQSLEGVVVVRRVRVRLTPGVEVPLVFATQVGGSDGHASGDPGEERGW